MRSPPWPPWGSSPRLTWRACGGKLDSAVFLDFLWREVAQLPAPPDQLPPEYRRPRECVVVLDNSSVHTSRLVQAVRPALLAARGRLFYLPPYSPELNLAEGVWRQVKYQRLPIRSYACGETLLAAVEEALRQQALQVHHSTSNLRDAA